MRFVTFEQINNKALLETIGKRQRELTEATPEKIEVYKMKHAQKAKSPLEPNENKKN